MESPIYLHFGSGHLDVEWHWCNPGKKALRHPGIGCTYHFQQFQLLLLVHVLLTWSLTFPVNQKRRCATHRQTAKALGQYYTGTTPITGSYLTLLSSSYVFLVQLIGVVLPAFVKKKKKKRSLRWALLRLGSICFMWCASWCEGQALFPARSWEGSMREPKPNQPYGNHG
jgi:hypothetical protein